MLAQGEYQEENLGKKGEEVGKGDQNCKGCYTERKGARPRGQQLERGKVGNYWERGPEHNGREFKTQKKSHLLSVSTKSVMGEENIFQGGVSIVSYKILLSDRHGVGQKKKGKGGDG